METILIVEDDRTYARATANWLARNGMDTRYVLSADAARSFWAAMKRLWFSRISVWVTATAWNCSNG